MGIDVSSTNVKVGLVSEDCKVMHDVSIPYETYDDGVFGKKFDMDELWNKIVTGIGEVLEKLPESDEVIAITSCAQRIAICFLDKNLVPFYGGPNKDTRGVDSQWLIDDEYEGEDDERHLFELTAHNPPLVFGLARLLYFKEEEEETFENMGKIMMLDDWFAFKLTGEIVSDPAIASESQLLNIAERKWSEEIIEKFELERDWFPPLIEPGTKIASLRDGLADQLGLPLDVPVVKTGPDTQNSLVGMGCVKPWQIGVPLGTSAPLMMVMSEPKIDPDQNFWTSCNIVPDTWVMEGNAGMTGMVYDWYCESIISDLGKNVHALMDEYLKKTKPGASSCFSFMGPELMNFKNQTDIKRSVFVFPSHSSISDIVTDKSTFARAIFENIGYAIMENFNGLKALAPDMTVSRVFCGGGMSNSSEVIQMLSDMLGVEIYVPEIRESSWAGFLMSCMVALGEYKSFNEAAESLLKWDVFTPDLDRTKKYGKLYKQWKRYKGKLDNL